MHKCILVELALGHTSSPWPQGCTHIEGEGGGIKGVQLMMEYTEYVYCMKTVTSEQLHIHKYSMHDLLPELCPR